MQGRDASPAHPSGDASAPPRDGPIAGLVWAGHPHGLVLSDAHGAIRALNPAARVLLEQAGPRLGVSQELCRIVGCHGPGSPLEEGCVHALAARQDGAMPEVRVDLPAVAGEPRAAWVTTARLPGAPELILTELRPGRSGDRRRRTEPHWVAGSRLRIITLGRTRLLGNEGPIEGRWLANRTGKVLKLLVTHRQRTVPTDEIAEKLWPGNTGSAVEGLRYFVHVLRSELEPAPRPRGKSSFVVGEPGGYALNLSAVEVDADEFERHVQDGLSAVRTGADAIALEQLRAGLALYGGEFLADEPYAEWAFAERDRLHDLAASALRALVEIHLRGDAPQEALADLERLAALEPFDIEIHREFLALLIARGRRSEAVRRFGALRHRMLTTFGEDLDFVLADLAVRPARGDAHGAASPPPPSPGSSQSRP